MFLFALPTMKLGWALRYPVASKTIKTKCIILDDVKSFLIICDNITIMCRMVSFAKHTLLLTLAVEAILELFLIEVISRINDECCT